MINSKLWNLSKAWLPPLVWAAFIFFLSDQSILPGFEQTLSDFIFKKSAHMFVYGVLYALTWRAIHLTSTDSPSPISPEIQWWLPLILTLGYAVSDEYHQSFVIGRTATIRDIGFDTMGMAIAIIILYVRKKKH